MLAKEQVGRGWHGMNCLEFCPERSCQTRAAQVHFGLLTQIIHAGMRDLSLTVTLASSQVCSIKMSLLSSVLGPCYGIMQRPVAAAALLKVCTTPDRSGVMSLLRSADSRW